MGVDHPHPAPIGRDLDGTTLEGAVADGGGRPAASFDTRIGKPKFLTGSAAKGIAHRLEQHGYRVVGSESFTVAGTAGPLQAGEAERACAWARGLVAG